MTLYEIDEALLNLVDPETGEVKDVEAFDALGMERDQKLENVACWIKNLEADNVAIKSEVDNLQDRIAKNKNKVEHLKAYLAYALNGQKFSTPKCVVSYRKSTKVETDEEFLSWAINGKHDEFLSYKAPEISKTAIKEALNSGVELEHAHLVENQSVSIK